MLRTELDEFLVENGILGFTEAILNFIVDRGVIVEVTDSNKILVNGIRLKAKDAEQVVPLLELDESWKDTYGRNG
jgi:hypothetical protein